MTQAKLHLAPDLALPLSAVTQTFAFLARRGAGKTYTASKLAEEMLDARAQVVVLDPVGNWYGLRLAADGKGPGFDIPVFGGEQGDIPLEPGAGALVADLIVDRELSVVLDVSSFRKGPRKQFATDFAEQLFHRKKTQRTPVHLFVEEAQVFVPERPMKGEERMLGAFVDLVRLGRNYGVGVSLISQRPQSVSKEALNQTEALFVLQTGGAHERRALSDWIVYQGVESKDVLNDVPSLPIGTAYLWSPQWLGVLRKVKIGKKRTFDASATPEVGTRVVAPKALAPVDLQAIRESMKTVVEQAKANDPRELKAEIARLKAAASKATAAAPARAERAVERIEVPVFKDGEVNRLEGIIKLMADNVRHFSESGQVLLEISGQMSAAMTDVSNALQAATAPRQAPSRPQPPARPAPGRGVASRVAALPLRADPKARESVTAPQQRILDALAWLESIGVHQAQKVQLALLAEQSPTSSGYTNNLGTLRTAGLIAYPAPSQAQLTDAGRAVANMPAAPPTTDELQRQVMARLPRPKAAILEALIAAYPDPVSKDELAQIAGQSPTSSGYTNNLGSLRSLGLIDYPAPGQAVALPVLFLE